MVKTCQPRSKFCNRELGNLKLVSPHLPTRWKRLLSSRCTWRRPTCSTWGSRFERNLSNCNQSSNYDTFYLQPTSPTTTNQGFDKFISSFNHKSTATQDQPELWFFIITTRTSQQVLTCKYHQSLTTSLATTRTMIHVTCNIFYHKQPDSIPSAGDTF